VIVGEGGAAAGAGAAGGGSTGAAAGAEAAEAAGDEVRRVSPELDRAVELGERIAGYPQASLVADRASALQALGVPLEQGLALEEERGVPPLSDPELARGLERYASGDRPSPPRPPD
jgi:enoyl-CoA hydratase